MVSPVRFVVARGGSWVTQSPEVRGLVLRRQGSTVAVVRVIDPSGRDQVPGEARRDVLHACR